ncbi:MAG: AAA family ATPase [Gammaproteobacteria bacterium]|nr:AAA family ATPase [Gammaproteobacteria bacterium]
MVDVFVSYAHEDVRRVEPLVGLLQAHGLDVWWDRNLEPGSRFESSIEAAIDSAACVLIALTEHAAQSDWMRAEAAAAQERDKVIPVLLDDVPLPLSLRALQVADLREWPDVSCNEAERLVHTIAERAQPSGSDFIGRMDALQTFEAALDATLNGRGGVVMLAGEPGIGKTRCAEEFARIAEDRGSLVLWGRCYEQPGAPAYWPWLQVLREYVDAHTDDELRIATGSNASALVALVPELAERLSLGQQSIGDGSVVDNQYRLFDAVSRVIARAAGNVPVVVVLDDLHWADGSSLALLEYVAKDVRRQRCLMVCTYRDVEVTRKSPILGTLGELGRSGRVDRIRLTGLSAEETERLLACSLGCTDSEVCRGSHPPADRRQSAVRTRSRPCTCRRARTIERRLHRRGRARCQT